MHRTSLSNRWFPRWAKSATIMFSSCPILESRRTLMEGSQQTQKWQTADQAVMDAEQIFIDKNSDQNLLWHVWAASVETGRVSFSHVLTLTEGDVLNRLDCVRRKWLLFARGSIWVLVEVNVISTVLFVLWSRLLAHLNTHVADSLP